MCPCHSLQGPLERQQERIGGPLLPLCCRAPTNHPALRRIQWLTEGSLALLVGLAAGGSLLFYFENWQGRHIPKDLLPFDTDIFFNVLLPPIIFNAGFSVKKKLFFQVRGVGQAWLPAAASSTDTPECSARGIGPHRHSPTESFKPRHSSTGISPPGQ